VAIAWIVISIMSIIVRLPFGEDPGFINGQFWTYMIVSVINAILAICLMLRGKKFINLSVLVIALTFVATETAARLTHKGSVTIGQSIASAILPAVLIILLYRAKENAKSTK